MGEDDPADRSEHIYSQGIKANKHHMGMEGRTFFNPFVFMQIRLVKRFIKVLDNNYANKNEA